MTTRDIAVQPRRPERWRLLRATWLTMGSQLNQVQQDFAQLHHLLRNIGRNINSSSNTPRPGSPSAQSCAQSSAAAAAAAGEGCSVGQQKPHGVCFDGFTSMEDSNAYAYAAAAVQVRGLLTGVYSYLRPVPAQHMYMLVLYRVCPMPAAGLALDISDAGVHCIMLAGAPSCLARISTYADYNACIGLCNRCAGISLCATPLPLCRARKCCCEDAISYQLCSTMLSLLTLPGALFLHVPCCRTG
jgi:hypothetical protein